MNIKTIGSWSDCDLVIEDDSVSPIHAQAQLTGEGYLVVLDAGSDQGTFLNRNDQWVRVMRVELGTLDRIRFGTHEIGLDRLAGLFGERLRVQLRDTRGLRMPLMMADRLAANDRRLVLERPKRNPQTGNIEEM